MNINPRQNDWNEPNAKATGNANNGWNGPNPDSNANGGNDWNHNATSQQKTTGNTAGQQDTWEKNNAAAAGQQNIWENNNDTAQNWNGNNSSGCDEKQKIQDQAWGENNGNNAVNGPMPASGELKREKSRKSKDSNKAPEGPSFSPNVSAGMPSMASVPLQPKPYWSIWTGRHP